MTLPEASLALASLASGIDVTASLLAQLQTAAADTVLMRQVGAEPTVLARIAEVLRALMTLALLALTVAVVPAAWNFRKSYKKINDLLDRVYADVTPLVRHAHAVADNVDYVTTALRVDMQQVSRTVNTANERLLDAVKQSERRLAEFNALLRVMQEEAEDVFVSTASAVRGVRTGAAAFGEDLEDDLALAARAPGSAPMEDRLARLEALAAEAAGELDTDDEDDDGDDDDDRAYAPEQPGNRPRIRPRGRA